MILPLALLVILAFLPGTYAFGAGKREVKSILSSHIEYTCNSSGNIPGHAYLEGKCCANVAFVHN